MAASISLSGLSWSTPDGHPVFTSLDLAFGPRRTGIVGRNGTGKSTLLRLIAGDLRPRTGQIACTGTLALMRQEAMTAPDQTIASLFGVVQALDVLARAEAGFATSADLSVADWTLPARIAAALLRCGLTVGPQTPLAALSGGQRTRAALAAVLFAEPDFLLLDEPTNNLDAAGRHAVIEVLRSWRGGALIVSHDRTLLAEMDAILELTPRGATLYGGNYRDFHAAKARETAAADRDLAHAEKRLSDTARNAQQAQERKARKDAAGQRGRAKGDQPKIQMDAAKGRAEASGGAGKRLWDNRRSAAEEAHHTARAKVEILQPLQMQIAPTGLSAGKTVLRLEEVTGGYDPARPMIRDLSLTLTGPERMAILGPNGSGKTTLLRLITGALTPQHGQVERHVPYALLDQRGDLPLPDATLRANFMRCNPQASAQLAHAALARFGFRAADGLRVAHSLSGGERLRAALACALLGVPVPQLLILDEPTNHLDLDGIAALEAAVAAYDGAVLVITHDAAFLEVIRPTKTLVLG